MFPFASIGDQTLVKLLKECKSLKQFYELLPPKRYIQFFKIVRPCESLEVGFEASLSECHLLFFRLIAQNTYIKLMILRFRDLVLFLQTCICDHVKLHLFCEVENKVKSYAFFNVFRLIFFFDENLQKTIYRLITRSSSYQF